MNLPLLGSPMPSNRMQTERVIRMVEDTGLERIGVLGLSFRGELAT